MTAEQGDSRQHPSNADPSVGALLDDSLGSLPRPSEYGPVVERALARASTGIEQVGVAEGIETPDRAGIVAEPLTLTPAPITSPRRASVTGGLFSIDVPPLPASQLAKFRAAHGQSAPAATPRRLRP